MPNLYIYSIHTVLFNERQRMVHSALQTIRELAIAEGYHVNMIFITKPDSDSIDVKSLETRVNYNPTNDAFFDKHISTLSMPQISQTMKHEAVWDKIVIAPKEDDALHLVIEDDSLIAEDSKCFLTELFKNKAKFSQPWDILFLGLMSGIVPTESLDIRPTSVTYKLLPCKEAYFINTKTAFRLKGGLSTIRFTLSLYLSHSIATLNLESYYLNKRITIDGSKLGIVPSTVRNNNMLILNAEAMHLTELSKQTPIDIEKYMKDVNDINTRLQQFQSPNVMHLYAKCHLQAKKYKEALPLMEQSISMMQSRKGCLGNTSEIVQDLIKIYGYMQQDLPELLSKKSKWINTEPVQL